MRELTLQPDVFVSARPFPHFAGFIPELLASKDLYADAFANELGWNLRERSFYSQYENASPIEKCALMSPFSDPSWIAKLRETVQSHLHCRLAEPMKINLIRLSAGQSINIHNDSPKLGFETHRVLIYLADSGDDFTGGELVLFQSHDAALPVAAFHPKTGVVIGFEASNDSFHCVMPISSGNRYAVQYYFWAEGNQPDIASRIFSTIQGSLSAWEYYEPAKPVVQNLRAQWQLDLTHGNTSLLNHLVETSAILCAFGAQEEVCIAGLVHSVGGTRNFKANGDLIHALHHREDASKIIELVRCYAAITDGKSLIRLVDSDPDLGVRVLQIWWANVLSSKAHITFSKKRHEEEREVFLHTHVPLSDLHQLLSVVYGNG